MAVCRAVMGLLSVVRASQATRRGIALRSSLPAGRVAVQYRRSAQRLSVVVACRLEPARRGHEVVEQPPELALDVDVAVRAPDDPEPPVAVRAASRRGGAGR